MKRVLVFPKLIAITIRLNREMFRQKPSSVVLCVAKGVAGAMELTIASSAAELAWRCFSFGFGCRARAPVIHVSYTCILPPFLQKWAVESI